MRLRLVRQQWLNMHKCLIVYSFYHVLLTIKFHVQSSISKLHEYPHPVASSITSRFLVELGMVTAVIAAAAAVIAGFAASAAFAVTSFLYAATAYVIWPLSKPVMKLALGIISSIAERIWENILDLFTEGGFFSRMYGFYTYGGVSASLQMLKPIMLVLVTMVLLVRFTLSRRPKNYRKWVIIFLLLLFVSLFHCHFVLGASMRFLGVTIWSDMGMLWTGYMARDWIWTLQATGTSWCKFIWVNMLYFPFTVAIKHRHTYTELLSHSVFRVPLESNSVMWQG